MHRKYQIDCIGEDWNMHLSEPKGHFLEQRMHVLTYYSPSSGFTKVRSREKGAMAFILHISPSSPPEVLCTDLIPTKLESFLEVPIINFLLILIRAEHVTQCGKKSDICYNCTASSCLPSQLTLLGCLWYWKIKNVKLRLVTVEYWRLDIDDYVSSLNFSGFMHKGWTNVETNDTMFWQISVLSTRRNWNEVPMAQHVFFRSSLHTCRAFLMKIWRMWMAGRNKYIGLIRVKQYRTWAPLIRTSIQVRSGSHTNVTRSVPKDIPQDRTTSRNRHLSRIRFVCCWQCRSTDTARW